MRLQGAAWETEQTSAPHMGSGQSANLQMEMTQLDVCILACNHQLPRGFSKKGVDSGLCANKYLAFKIKWFQLATSLDCRAQPWQNWLCFSGAKHLSRGSQGPPSKCTAVLGEQGCLPLFDFLRSGGVMEG